MSIQRFGVSIDPTVFVVEYRDAQQNGKKFTKRINLDKHLEAEVTAEDITAAILKKHSKLFGSGSTREVYQSKIRELVDYAMMHYETSRTRSAAAAKHGSSSATDDHNNSAPSSSSSSSSSSAAAAAAPATFVFKKVTVNSDPNEILNMDLNTVSDEVNQKAKQIMDVDFEAKRLKPGDEGFVWDKEVEFAPAEEDNDWDEEDD